MMAHLHGCEDMDQFFDRFCNAADKYSVKIITIATIAIGKFLWADDVVAAVGETELSS